MRNALSVLSLIAASMMSTTVLATEPPSTDSSTSPEVAKATEAVAPSFLPGDQWVIRVQPRVWYVAPEGDLKIPSSGGGRTVDLGVLDLDQPKLAPYGEVNIQADHWLFSFSGAGYDGESRQNAEAAFQLGDVAVGAGDPFKASLKIATFNLLAGYKVWQYEFEDAGTASGLPASNVIRLWAVGGGRITNLDFEIRSGGSTDSASQTWADLVGGLRAEAQIARDFSVDAEITFGGLSGSSSFDLSAGLSWRPVDWCAAQIGYRLMNINREDGTGRKELNFDGGLAGLFAGVVFRF